MVHNIYKPLGWTPLQTIDAFRQKYPDFADVPITYAGRLDPMAEGALVLLSGEDRYKKEEFLRLDKTYKATFLFDVISDTYDCLGLVKAGSAPGNLKSSDVTSFLLGTHTLPFPTYSSYKVQGKPLHWWAKEGRLGEIEIPKKEMTVLACGEARVYTQNFNEVRAGAIHRIKLVKGEFRQQEGIESWDDLSGFDEVQLAEVTLKVTSGTYIRSLAEEMGRQFGCGALLYSLKREAVDEYGVNKAMSFEI